MVCVEISRLKPRDFNSYGSRRGNDDVMARGTFANIRLMNKFIGKAAPKTVHVPSKEVVSGYIVLSASNIVKYMIVHVVLVVGRLRCGHEVPQ